MNNNRKNLGMFLTFNLYCFVCAMICLIISSNPYYRLMGILIGYIIVLINWVLLVIAIRILLGINHFIAVQFLIFRMLIYFGGAWICAHISIQSALLYAVTIIGLSFAILIVYGKKGGLCFVKHR